MKRLAVAFAVVWLCFVAVGAARALTFPALSGRVVDEAQLLTPAERAALTASLADLEAKTTDQFVIVTLKSLQGTTIEDYGYQLGRHWQIGQKDKNSGVLLIVAAAGARADAVDTLRDFVREVKTGRANFTQTVTAPDGAKKKE